MKRIALFYCIIFFFASCGIGKQTQELKTLADCKYSIVEVNNVLLSGTNVQEIIANRNINLGSIPSLALGFISKNIPLKADLIISIENPTNNHAAINYFDYEILVNQQNFTEGTVDKKINIAPKEITEVDLALSANIYKFLVNDSVRNDIQTFISATQNQSEAKALITIRIKPAIYVNEQLVKYPGFIDIEHELDNSLLLK